MSDRLQTHHGKRDFSSTGSTHRARTALAPLEWAVLAHVGIFLLWLTWGFGGGAEWMRPSFAWWGSLGGLITVAALRDRETQRNGARRTLRWLLPFLGFNALVFVACANPSFQAIVYEGETLLLNRGGSPFLPSSARPQLALRALWLFDAIFISCFNIALVIRQRRALRALLILVAVNALVLAIFGTAQKLAGAPGIFFGAVPTRQPYFFASFIYHNHWGAFMLLCLGACLGLAWHYARRFRGRNLLHSPAVGVAVGIFLLAATVPLSGSRSCSLFLLVLLGGALAHGAIRVMHQRRRHNESIVPPLLALGLVAVLAAGGIWLIAQDTIRTRTELTRRQVAAMVAQGGVGDRLRLYGDTWRMAQAKPWFGWGMASYPHVFTLYDTQAPRSDRLKGFYRDAHNDWLQSLAEHGFVGSALLALCAVLPVSCLRRRHFKSPVVAYLVSGCAILLAYAWLEFPFGNIAVVLLWWLCCFTAIQYARLQDNDIPVRRGAGTPSLA